MNRKKAFTSFFPDDRIHLHNVCVRIFFKELTEVFVFHFSGKINVPDVEQTGIYVVLDGLFAAHQFILIVDIDLVGRLPLFHKRSNDLIESADFVFGNT